MKKTLIFDFDGVVVDSLTIAFEVNRMTRPTLTLESYKDKFRNNDGIRAGSKAVWDEPTNGSVVDFQEEFAKKMTTLKLKPEKKAVLQKLGEKYNLHIISSTDTETIKAFLRSNGIDQLFGEVLGFDIEPSKTKKFQMLFKKYNLNPMELIFVTDTAGDIEEAREVGISTIVAVADGYQGREVLEAAEPAHTIDSIVDLEKVI